MNAEINVAGAERWASAIGGAVLAVYGVKHLKDERSLPAAMMTAAGAAFLFRSATGFCPAYAAAGINTAQRRYDTRYRRYVTQAAARLIDRPRASGVLLSSRRSTSAVSRTFGTLMVGGGVD